MGSLTILEHRYQVRLLDATDQVTHFFDDLTSIYYKKAVNQIGMAILTVPDGHAMLDAVATDSFMEVYLSYPLVPALATQWGITWVSDFQGLYRDRQIATDRYGNIYHLLYFPGLNEVLSREIIAYPAQMALRSAWTSTRAAIIANEVVKWNCTSFATTGNGRLRDAEVIRNLDAAGAVTGTPIIDFAAAHQPVLEVMQELADYGSFDFQVSRTGGIPGQISCIQYAGQLGTDRSASIIFDLALDNVAGAGINGDKLREKTVAVVGGQGEKSTRTFSLRTGANYGAGNQYEVFVDARQSSAAELPAIGDQKLQELQARAQLQMEVAMSQGYMYRRDYGMGDLVTASFAGTLATKKIDAVEVNISAESPGIAKLELVDA